jgi:hypothetical protein
MARSSQRHLVRWQWRLAISVRVTGGLEGFRNGSSCIFSKRGGVARWTSRTSYSQEAIAKAAPAGAIKSFGRGTKNHWVSYGNGIWRAARWDPTYPTYAVPENSERDPDGAKFELIVRYVREYNDRLHALAARWPEKIMLVRTEELNEAAAQKAIFDFAGVRGRVAKAELNVGTKADGKIYTPRALGALLSGPERRAQVPAPYSQKAGLRRDEQRNHCR